MRGLKYILFIICLYIYLFNPVFQFLGFGLVKILLLFSILYLINNGDFILIFHHFKIELFFTIVLVIYLLYPLVLLGDITGITAPYAHIIWFLECFIIPIFLLSFFRDIFETHTWESQSVIVGTIASIITLFLILNPDINIWLRESIIIDPLDSNFNNMFMRGFSLAEGSSFNYGIMQGFITALCLFLLTKSYFYAIPILPLLISILFNARIGFSVVIIALTMLIISRKISYKIILIVIALVFLGFIIYNNSSFVNENEKSMEWGLSFFEDTFSVFSKGDTSGSNYEILTNDMLFFPQSIIGLLFGEGRSVFTQSNQYSDIGYVNQIFAGGLFYLLLMFFFMWYMFKRSIFYGTEKFYTILFFISLMVINVKGGAFFVSNGFYRFFALYYIYSIFVYEKRINDPQKVN